MQPPPKPWKQAIFAAIARAESTLRGRPAYRQADLLKLRNFLVLQYEPPLGSVVHATPFYEALKTAMPDAHVTVAASSMAASVLQYSPYIDRCVVTPDPFRNFRPALNAVRELFRTMPPGPRCIVTTIGNQRTRIAALGLWAGRAARVGYTLARELYHVPLTFHPERGQIEGNLDILRALGHPVPFYGPQMFFTASEADYAQELLAVPQASGRPCVAFVTQNSGGQRNQWPAERFQQVSVALSNACGAFPVFVGTAADAASIEALRRPLAERGISLAGKTTVAQLAAVLAQCDLVVSLDTGAFHVARAVGLPGVVIAPAWQNPVEWLPVNLPQYRVLRGPSIPTAPADYWIEEVSPGQATDATLDLLEKFPPTASCRAARMHRSTSRHISH
ncbi:MAG: glycosyltransferase family 9 protein [Acidobacteriaceae bacterium]